MEEDPALHASSSPEQLRLCGLPAASSSSQHCPAVGGESSRFCPGCCLHAIQQPEKLTQTPLQWLIERELEQSL